jgi:hypothetical protein
VGICHAYTLIALDGKFIEVWMTFHKLSINFTLILQSIKIATEATEGEKVNDENILVSSNAILKDIYKSLVILLSSVVGVMMFRIYARILQTVHVIAPKSSVVLCLQLSGPLAVQVSVPTTLE